VEEIPRHDDLPINAGIVPFINFCERGCRNCVESRSWADCPQWWKADRLNAAYSLEARACETSHRCRDRQASDTGSVLIIEAQHECYCLPACRELIGDNLPCRFHSNQTSGSFVRSLEALRVCGDPMVINEVHVEASHFGPFAGWHTRKSITEVKF
jgi:hypothetical protein